MPKQSKKSAKQSTSKKVKAKSSFGVLFLKYGPFDLLFFVLLALVSMFIRFWPLEFIASYIPQILILIWTYAAIYATVVTYFAFINDFKFIYEKLGKIGIGSLVASLLIGVFTLSYSLNLVMPQPGISDTLTHQKEHFTIGTFNKLYKSTDFNNDTNLILASKLDVFSLQEATETEVDFLKARLNHDYSYVTDCDCSALETEVGLISKHPIINAMTIYEHPNSVIARNVISSEDFGEFVVYVVHMHVPYVPSSYDLRDNAFNKLSAAINQETLPVFVIGDFNTTVFSPDMKKFVDETPAVQNVVARSWPQCSWFGTPLGELACARIDYVFAPSNATAYSLEIGNQDASDHRSVTAEVSF